MKSAALRAQLEGALGARFPAPFGIRERYKAEALATGIPEVDSLTGGLPRGALTEVCGSSSSGRTSLLLALFTEIIGRDEVVALVDANDAFDPHSAQAAGVELKRLLWVRCHKVEQVLKATDLLVQSGGFGLIAVDLGDVPIEVARRVPLTSWFRFRGAVENTPTALVVLEQEPYAKTCASLVLRMEPQSVHWSAMAIGGLGVRRLKSENRNSEIGLDSSGARRRRVPHACLLRGARLKVELVRSRVQRQPARADSAAYPIGSTEAWFETRTAWGG